MSWLRMKFGRVGSPATAALIDDELRRIGEQRAVDGDARGKAQALRTAGAEGAGIERGRVGE
jgi:hypothetical protein